MKVLITGVAGKLGRMVANLLCRSPKGYKVYGMDRRLWPDAPKGLEMFNVDLRKRAAEDVFRLVRPDAVIHMATVSHFYSRQEERYRINLRGTRTIFDYCHNHGVKHVIFVGRHTIYGAAPDAPLYYTEADPPMAVTTFTELADLVAADLYAGSALWRHPEMATTVLRLCYTLGPSRHGTLAAYIGAPRVGTVMGFDPLFQFMHEQDAAEAICLTLEHRLRGVYNVAGPQPIPFSVVIKMTGAMNVPIPQPLFKFMSGKMGLPRLPESAVNHIKFPVVMDDTAFRKATGFEHTYDEVQTMQSFRWA
jgi:UDP-glucose 4-epimerase